MADDALRAPIRETFAVLHQHLVQTVTEGSASGEFAADLDAEQVASAIAAVVQGGYSLARAEQSIEPFDRAVRGVLALLRAGQPASGRLRPARCRRVTPRSRPRPRAPTAGD